MFSQTEEILETIEEAETLKSNTFTRCGLCGEPLLHGELTAHSDCHRAEHIRSYLQDEEKIS